MRRLGMMRYPAFVALLSGAWIAAFGRAGGAYWWLVAPLLLAALCAAVVIAQRSLDRSSAAAAYGLGAFAVIGAAAFGAFTVLTAPDKSMGFGTVVIGMMLGYWVITGVRLLARQSSWDRMLPWLLPAALSIVPLGLTGLGLSLPALYLHAFDLDLEDVDVPSTMRLLAALKVLAAASIWLLAPALLGYMRHTHHMISARWMGYSAAVFASVLALLMGVVGLAFLPAVSEGQRAVAEASKGGTPTRYFGIRPEWVCVSTVKDLAQVPVDGGTLDPNRSYLSLGDADGTAVLWDAKSAATLKIPLSFLRIVPVDNPRPPCP
ncbi:hypothetical protein [Streptomyces sp. NPDC048272]|uniref:hypothetical protein n=1 Tax=Streptomyces sp. NPDC048272 TaxID=3154616 RepID=UPI00342448E8